MSKKQQRRQANQHPHQLTSIEHGCFDTATLQQELAQALEEDRVYKLTDSMKKRAIRTAANYDEFKNLVACADLKPVSQKELRNFTQNERSTNLSFKKKTRKELGKALRFQESVSLLDQPPETAVDFCRNWKRYLKTTEDKFRYLQLTTPERLCNLFKADIDADLMAGIIHVLLLSWKHGEQEEEQAMFALLILEALSATSRFSLILDFLDNNQLDRLHVLFDLITKAIKTNKEGNNDQQIKLKNNKKTFKL